MDWEAKIRAWLDAHRYGLSIFTFDKLVTQVKLFVLFGQNVLSDDQVRKVIQNWLLINPTILASPTPFGPGGAAPIGPPTIPPAPLTPDKLGPIVDSVKKIVGTIADGVTFSRGPGSVNIKATGLTGKLTASSGSAELSVSWSGTVGLKAESGPFHFSAELTKESWEMSFTFPDDDAVPNLSTLPDVFSKGEAAIRKVAVASAGFSSISDVGKIGAVVKKNSDDIQDAVDAVSGIPAPDKKSGHSFGFKLGSPPAGPGQQGIPPGIQGTFNFTWWF